MSLIYIGGINGVGKTTIVNELAKITPHTRVFHGSAELMKALGLSIGDYDSLRKIPDNIKACAIEKIFRDLSESSHYTNTIIVAHYIKILNGEISPNYGPWYLYCQKLVLITSSPEEILDRINSDESSEVRVERNLFGLAYSYQDQKLAFLKKAQDVSRQMMMDVSKDFSLPSFIVENTDGSRRDVVSRLIQIIQER